MNNSAIREREELIPGGEAGQSEPGRNGHPAVLMVGNFLSAHVSTRSVCEELADRFAGKGWRILRTSSRPNRLARLVDMAASAWRMRNEYRLAQVDVYSGPAFVWAEGVCAILRAARKPYVLTLHGGNLPSFAAQWPRRVRALLGSAAVVTTPSRYLQETMRPYRSDLELLPNPLDLTRYEYRLRDRPLPRLVWLRAFHRIYNPRLAADVVARLAREIPDVQLMMVGPDKGDGSLAECRQAAAGLKVEQRITFVGGIAKNAVPRFLNQGDIFINTTDVDNTPVSVLEAMACGLPVVSTNVGGIPYLVEHGTDALLVPAKDGESMAASVHQVLREPGLSERLSQNGRERVERCDWPVVFPRWEQIFHRLSGTRVGSC